MRRFIVNLRTCVRRLTVVWLVCSTGISLINAQTNNPVTNPPSPPAQTPSQLPPASTQTTTPATDSPVSPINARSPVQRDVPLGKLTAVPGIDGVMSEGEWKGAARVELGFQVQPGDNAPPSEATEVSLASDREHLYLAFHAFDSNPSAVRARVTRRDDVYNDDYVAVYLDTYDDRRRAYVLYFNPLGIQADGIITGGNLATTGGEVEDLTWDGIYTSKGAITKDGYIVEAAIPFKSLRFQAGKGKRWGLHIGRFVARKAERIYWQPISRDRSELLAQMGTVSGLDDVYTGRTLDLIPTLTASINGEREAFPLMPSGARLNSVNRLEPGLTATYTITPNLTLSAAINPDFSQIEADVPQIDVNQRFPLFFPERRPFFLEGAETFSSPGLLTFVNTRQIVDPDWGVKLTGKIGKNTIGILSASDRAPGFQRLQPTSLDFGKNAQFNILRYQRDILRNSRVGAFFTDHRFAGTTNTVAAVDGQILFRDVNTIGFQFGHSRSRGTDGNMRGGVATYAWYEHRGRHWRVLLRDNKITSDYRAQAGFVRRTGFHLNSGNFGYEFQKEKSWWVNVRPFTVVRYLRTDAGFVDESYIDPGAAIKLARGIDLYIYHSFHKDSFAGRTFPYQFDVAYYTVNTFKRITFDGFIQFGEGVNFDPRNPALGKRVWQSHTVTFKPDNRLNTQLLYLSDRIMDRGGSGRLLRQDIIRSRTIYQFTRNNAIRVILDYDTARRQTGVSFLYAYTPRPNTALYIGYNDLLFNGIDPLDNTRAQGIFRQRRTLFTKLSYNFRF